MNAGRPAPSAEEFPAEADALGVLGLARRAGHAVVGSAAVHAASRQGAVKAILLARGIGDNAHRRLRSALRTAPAFECGTMEELGAAVGRSHAAVVGVTDAGLADRVVGGLSEYRPS